MTETPAAPAAPPAPNDGDAADESGENPFTPAYSNYVLALLFIAYVFNFIDRTIPAMLVEPIKQDLGVSDTQMGLLTGTMFALFYAVMGIPIARLADVWVRKNIIAIGLGLWSVMTAATGLAQSFAQMAAARVGVGVGEAALSPPAHSMIASYFSPARRATALGIYAMGIHIGILFGSFAGDFLREVWGWRTAFIAVGLPGLGLAALMWFTVKEPPKVTREAPPPVLEVFRFLWNLRSFRHASFAAGLTAFVGYSFVAWAPTYLERVHGMVGTERGFKYGLVLGVGGAIGSVLAGWLSDRFGKNDVRWWLWVPAVATVGPLPFTLTFFFHDHANPALAWVFPGLIIAAMYQAPLFATVQSLAKEQMRAVASGILLLIINLVGLACGPPAVGLLNDYVFDGYGVDAIRYSMGTILVVMGVWGLFHFLWGARTLKADLRARNT